VFCVAQSSHNNLTIMAGKSVIILELLMGNAVAQLCTIFGYARELDCGKHNDKPYGRRSCDWVGVGSVDRWG